MTDQIQLAVEQLYENEALTDGMPDEAAQILLNWGEGQLRNVKAREAEEIKKVLQYLEYPLKTINRLIEQHAELSETQMVQRLIKLVEQSMQLAAQKSLIPPLGDNNEAL